VNVSEPFTTISTTTRPIHANSSFGTSNIGEEFDVHRKVQLPFEVVMDFGPNHIRKKVLYVLVQFFQNSRSLRKLNGNSTTFS